MKIIIPLICAGIFEFCFNDSVSRMRYKQDTYNLVFYDNASKSFDPESIRILNKIGTGIVHLDTLSFDKIIHVQSWVCRKKEHAAFNGEACNKAIEYLKSNFAVSKIKFNVDSVNFVTEFNCDKSGVYFVLNSPVRK